MKVKIATDKVDLTGWTWGIDTKALDKIISKQVTKVLREQLASDGLEGLSCWIEPEGIVVIDLPFGDDIGDVTVKIPFETLLDEFLEYQDDPERIRQLRAILESAAKRLAEPAT